MLIFAIDDEKTILEETAKILSEAEKEAEVRIFTRGAAALEEIRKGNKPEFIFSDIEMPGLSGLEFAVRVKTLSPETRIVFVTGYEQYAIEAFKIKVHGYLLKPLTVEAVRGELKWLPKEAKPEPEKLTVTCFGHFDVFWQGEPVVFSRKKSKELLAYLIDRKGAACSSDEIVLALWEDGKDRKAEQNRFRVIVNDLKNTLREIGQEKILIREHRQIAIQKDLIDCDYYRMLEGDMEAVNSYRGEYMKDYSWAELSNARLYFKS